ncbi:hypothetical protein B0H67DRAFT_139355 [Lasiosphaeris hirsuta]|uniref:Uncharacterized protein n=1 Tax=Lasiosphaeris hirsuta TaxID=260670 RepID=A0AA40B179_9PEZI|nr:hypothetical protein B0H67DRAFT_139355 [Lasiosphaeris hirsuta]
MDASGTYGSVFGGNSQIQPGAPSANSEQYKVNVSRQKTRKWAQFKPQNYDGDDWGTDYDDAPEDAPPPPPAKPAGPRQPSTLPSSRQNTPTGQTPLHIQTQRLIPSPTGPVSAGGALERTGIEQIVSPQSVVPQSAAATGSNVFTGTPLSAHPAAPFPLRTKSPATPHGAEPVPARFPTRESSVGAQDATNPPTETAPQFTSAPPPDSRVDARPASPGVTSPTSPNKALPFIRPADIYKRLEEEKRKSLESGGRPSMDSITTASRGDYSSTIVQPELPDQKRSEEATDTSRSARPSLAPVAERKSEYGLEGLIASYGSDDIVEPAPWTQSQTSAAAAAPEQERSGSSSPFSRSSPKLPELGRMSGFGDDLFSTPSKFMAGSTSKPSVPAAAQFSAVAPHSAVAPLSASAPAAKVPPQFSSGVEGAEGVMVQPAQLTTGIRSTSPPNDSGRSVGLPLQQDRANATQPASDAPERQGPAAEASRLPTSSTDSKQTAQRPTLPGSWVTETPSTPGESATPAATGAPRRLARRTVESGEVSPLTEADDSVEDSLAKATRSHKPSYDGSNDSVNEPGRSDQQISTGSRAGVPLALHPLRTGSPAVSTSKQMAPGPNASRIGDDGTVPSQPRDAKDHELASPVPNTATTHGSDMTPIAPLNPNRNPHLAGIAEQHFVPPPSFDNGSTLDTTSSSPLKESDMLRDEIIKSLSPMNPSNDFLDVTGGGTTAAYHAAAGPVRESSYLTDVYGDYWAAPADKPAPSSVDSPNKTISKRSTGTPTHPPVEAEKHDDVPPVADADNIQTSGSEQQFRDLRRRFSWEIAAEEEANAQRRAMGEQAEQSASRPDVGSIIGAGPTSSLETEPVTLSIPKSDKIAAPSHIPTGGMSHQVSQASTLPPRLAADAPIEPPSPISVVSDRNTPLLDSAEQKSRRLSLAEQKSTMQSSSHPLSPTPPIEQHPAIVNEQYQQQIPATPTKTDIGSMMVFRQIMELSTYSERINTYNETRQQFAAMDTGLNDWMTSMISQHPEHGNASYSFKTGLMDPGVTASQQGSQVPTQVNVQTPYFQQHANPSTTAFGQAPRLVNHMPMPPTPQHSSGAFGHSGAQVGTKGKELFMAAGKAGKGLLSKGKSKLKGTGDKVPFFNS